MRGPLICKDLREAVACVPSGASIMVGGFITGAPWNLTTALFAGDATDLTFILNSIGTPGLGAMRGPRDLIECGRVRRLVAAFTSSPHPSRHSHAEELAREGKLEIELMAQGTLAERIRAGGAGIPAFFTPAAVGTALAAEKETREFGGRPHVMETGLTADFAFVHAWKADTAGNLVFRMSSRNFNPLMATAARCTIVEVEEPILPAGALRPDEIHTPGLYVHRMVHIPAGANVAVNRHPGSAGAALAGRPAREPAAARRRLDHDQVAAVAARYLEPGWTVNLGVGIPSLASTYIDPAKDILLTAENGLIGYGMVAPEELADRDTVNASGHYVLVEDGASVVHHADSFGLIRSGHLDCVILGAYEVAVDGSFANWKPDASMPLHLGSIGGAMDLAAGAKRIFVAMEHTTRDGRPRLVERCRLPITAPGGVVLVVTDLAVVAVHDGAFELLEYALGSSVAEVQALTGAPLRVSAAVREMAI